MQDKPVRPAKTVTWEQIKGHLAGIGTLGANAEDRGQQAVAEQQELNEVHANGHALLLMLQKRIQTPICLDESIHNRRDALAALNMESCRMMPASWAGLAGSRSDCHP